MKKQLRPVLDRTLTLFREDDRVVAAFMTGSAARGQDDEHADVDPWLLVRAEAFESFDRDLPGIFRAAGVEPVLWWPERCNCETLRNYAVMFHAPDGVLIQYDITFQAWEGGEVGALSEAFLFDKAGVLQEAEPAPQPASRVAWTAELYWIYVYIHCKYLLRGDWFRLAAAQQELLQAHVNVLRALTPEVAPDWWPILAARVGDDAAREVLRSYLDRPTVAGVAGRLVVQTERFAQDARRACEARGEAYPEAFAEAVKRHVAGTLEELGES
jgi:hypothetical protein